MKQKLQNLVEKIKLWSNIWVFVILFLLTILFTLIGWKVIVGFLLKGHWLGVPISMLFLFALLVFLIGLILAISETNKYTASIIFLLIGTATAILGYQITNKSLALNWGKIANDFYANISAEMISIAITVLVIDSLATRLNWRSYVREEAEKEQIEKNPEHLPKEKIPLEIIEIQEAPGQNLFQKGIAIGAFFGIFGMLFGYFLGRKE